MNIRTIKESLKKEKKEKKVLNLSDTGFESDYYTYHDKKLHKKLSSKTIPLNIIQEEELSKYFKRILCTTIGYNFNIQPILFGLKSLGFNVTTTEQSKHLIQIKFESDKNIFIYMFGVVVLWSFDEREEDEIIKLLIDYCKNVIANNNQNKGVFYYRKGENFHFTERNKIIIESNNVTEKLAISYGLGQDTILNHFESEVDDTIEETKKIPIELRDHGTISLSNKEISRNIGLIFMRRSAVNLNRGVLDDPDIFREQGDEVENYYNTVRRNLEINKRLEILDKRMMILKELYEVLNSDIKSEGMFRLEWIVVYLIIIEIFISLFWKVLVKDLLKLF
jgi:uncharacterized Rmd1/YagE family protein